MNQASINDDGSRPRTIKEGGRRQWIHAANVSGRYAKLRLVSSSLLLLLFFAAPWLSLDGAPLLRLSFLSSSFVMFGQHILIYEFHHFALLALLLVITLFLASAALGRIWCGYACPQTVFIEQILGRIETLCEGPAAHRIAMEGKPLTAGRVTRKIIKQLLYLTVSLAFSLTLVAIFTGPELLFSEWQRGAWTAVLFFTALAWFDGAYWREQFCHMVCPYGRLQSVMQDSATRTIGYDQRRGEPRRRGKDRQGAGDCIDCGRCTRVCPSGIDIRAGAHQIECIGCARCIDACDAVMDNLGLSRGLVRYDAALFFVADQHHIDGASKLARPAVWRPRIAVYTCLWLTLCGFGIYEFVTRAPFHVLLLSTPNGLPYVVEGERLKNLLSLKIGNQSRKAATYEISLLPIAKTAESSANFEHDVASWRIESPLRIGPVPIGKEVTMPVLISAPRAASGASFRLEVRTLEGDHSTAVDRRILGPGVPGQKG